jgi:hypothetical protein
MLPAPDITRFHLLAAKIPLLNLPRLKNLVKHTAYGCSLNKRRR